jgi:hypothetical protein
MGTLVGGLIILVNSVTIVRAVADVPPWLGWSGVLAIVVTSGFVARQAWRRERAERASAVERALALHSGESRAEAAVV